MDQAKEEVQQFAGAIRQFVHAQDWPNGAKAQFTVVHEQLQANRTLSEEEQKALRSFSDLDVLIQP